MAGKPCGICKHQHRVTIEARMAQGDSDNSIAKEFELHPSSVSIHRLKHLNLSPARMNPAQLAAYNQALQGFALGSAINRLAGIQTLVDKMDSIIKARAEAFAHCVGGETGLVVSRKRTLYSVKLTDGSTEATVVDDEEVDLAMVKEYRNLVQMAASLCGEWQPGGAAGETAAEGAQVTIQQVIHGHSAIAVSADPRPGARQIPLTREPLTLPIASTPPHSSQSVHQSIDSGETLPGAAVRVDDGADEG